VSRQPFDTIYITSLANKNYELPNNSIINGIRHVNTELN
jgi:hypothetical protein